MWRLLFDEDFNSRIARGLHRLLPNVDIETVVGAGLSGASDAEVLAWAAAHDRATIPRHAYDRVRRGAAMAGVIIVNKRSSVGNAVSELALVLACCGPHELVGRVLHVPF